MFHIEGTARCLVTMLTACSWYHLVSNSLLLSFSSSNTSYTSCFFSAATAWSITVQQLRRVACCISSILHSTQAEKYTCRDQNKIDHQILFYYSYRFLPFPTMPCVAWVCGVSLMQLWCHFLCLLHLNPDFWYKLLY